MARRASPCGGGVAGWVDFVLVKEGAKEEALGAWVCHHTGARAESNSVYVAQSLSILRLVSGRGGDADLFQEPSVFDRDLSSDSDIVLDQRFVCETMRDVSAMSGPVPGDKSSSDSLLASERPSLNSATRCSNHGVTCLPLRAIPFWTLSATAWSTARCSSSPTARYSAGIGFPSKSEEERPSRSVMTAPHSLRKHSVAS